jgi:hypothetical protein
MIGMSTARSYDLYAVLFKLSPNFAEAPKIFALTAICPLSTHPLCYRGAFHVQLGELGSYSGHYIQQYRLDPSAVSGLLGDKLGSLAAVLVVSDRYPMLSFLRSI